jgi:hypothetical protein
LFLLVKSMSMLAMVSSLLLYALFVAVSSDTNLDQTNRSRKPHGL